MRPYESRLKMYFFIFPLTTVLGMTYFIQLIMWFMDLQIKDTTDTDRSASYLDLHLKINSEGRLRTKLYVKRNYFNFPIVQYHIEN
jgi:hypothetical protein